MYGIDYKTKSSHNPSLIKPDKMENSLKFQNVYINMFKLIPFIALSTGMLCYVNNCLQCSSSSPHICLGCKTSHILSSSGCLYSEGHYNDLPPNCREFSDNKTCLKCEEGYHEFKGFCEADCNNDCVCFRPFECILYSIENDKQASSNQTLCMKGCSKCHEAETCIKCKKGYYKNFKDHCLKCAHDCKTCSTSAYCDKCKKYDSKGNPKCNLGIEFVGVMIPIWIILSMFMFM